MWDTSGAYVTADSRARMLTTQRLGTETRRILRKGHEFFPLTCADVR